MSKKIGALIPVRLTSERLPGKALMEMSGRPVLYHLLDRVAASRHITSPRDVVVCTTEAAEDDPLQEAVEAYGASVFRGAVDDIIKRFGDAMTAFDFDAVIQADGDDPLSATEYMDATMDRLLDAGAAPVDIVTVDGLPLGCATKSFSREGMEKVLRRYRTERNDTGFIYFFTKSGFCAVDTLTCTDPAHRHDKARLTLDYPVDFEVFSAIFDALYRPGEVFSHAELVAFLNANPDLVERNRSVEEEYWSRTRDKAQLEFVDEGGNRRQIEV